MAGRRRSNGKQVSQKGKDGKRPRAFHRGQAQGRRNDKLMRSVLEPAYARAEQDVKETVVRANEHRRTMRDYEDCLAQCDRVSSSCALALPAFF